MFLHKRSRAWIAIFVAAISGCAHVQANNASNARSRGEAEQLEGEMNAQRGLQYTIGPQKDYNQAFVFFRKAADEGSVVAEFSVAQSYEAGHGVPKDEAKALVWYRKAAEHGLPTARARLRTMFVRGQLIPHDDEQGGKWWHGLVRQAAEESRSFGRAQTAAQSNADFEVELGIDYLTGIGVPRDRTQATFIFQQAAGRGQPDAQCLASSIFAADDDWSVPQETKHVADLCLTAANQGYADAQLILSFLYTTGRGVPKDATQVALWHRKAAEQGRREAAYMVSRDYELGTGVPKDEAQSLIWLRKAADQGYPIAMTLLGFQASAAHLTGEKDPLDDPELAKKFVDRGVEFTSDMDREMLPNLWASRSQQGRERQMQKRFHRDFAPALKAMGEDGL